MANIHVHPYKTLANISALYMLEPGICGRKKGTGKAEKTMGGRREGMDGDDDGGLCEEREEQGAMEEDDVVDSGLRSAAMRMVTTTTTSLPILFFTKRSSQRSYDINSNTFDN